jgi:glycosyltransferase involved in cell wall biosynthesis
MNILYLGAHSVLEYDDLRLLTGLGYDVFSIGSYIEPAKPGDDLRPPLPEVPDHPELRALVSEQEEAKSNLPDGLIDWADTIICAAKEHTYLFGQWSRIRHKRVVWRTIGQSVENNEELMYPLRQGGLQVVRYSPKERNLDNYVGEDALIRFYKDPDEYGPWTGEVRQVVTFAQALKRRHPFTNYEAWQKATDGLPAVPYGPESEEIGGFGKVSHEEQKRILATSRAYFHTGTQPASYTLGLVEAMMTGIPVVAVGPVHGNSIFGLDLYEAHELVGCWSDDTATARGMLEHWLRDDEDAAHHSQRIRSIAIEHFAKDRIAAQWQAFLG